MTWADVTGALTNCWTLVTDCVDFFTQNAALMVMFVGGLVPVGFKIFRKAKRAAK